MAKRYTQPQSGPARIDWSNPITRGLLYAFNPAFGVWNAVSGKSDFVIGGSKSVSSLGIIQSQTGTAKVWNAGNAANNPTNITQWQRIRRTGVVGSYCSAIGKNFQSNTGPSYISWDVEYNPGGNGQNYIRANQGISGAGVNGTGYVIADATIWHDIAVVKPTGLLNLFINGVLVASDSAGPIAYGTSGNNDLATNFSGTTAPLDYGPGFVWGRDLSAAEIASLTANPHQIFAPQALPIWVAASGGGGVSLTGQSATVAQGSVGPSITLALTGQSVTTAQGTVSVGSQNITLALTGQSITAAQGTATPSSSVPITGQSVTAAQGTVSPTLSTALTGQSTTVVQGSVGPSISIALTGQSTSVAQGTVSVANTDITLALTGQSVALAQGTLSPATSVPVTGQSVTAAQGNVTPNLSASFTSQSVALAQGSVAPSTTVGLAGQSVSVGQGTMIVSGADVTVALTGQSIAVQQGSMSVASAPSASKSGVSRQWLIDYYTEAFAKKDKLPDSQGIAKLKTAAARKKAIQAAEIAQEEAIENLVAKAENDLQILTQGIKDSDAAREFTYNLISQAKKHIAAEVDFIAVAEQYQNRIRQENDELLLFAMVL